MTKLFGTDGVRGEANTFISPELALRLGKAAAHILKGIKSDNRAIIIGKDTRISGDMLEASLASGICSMGIDVYLLGICPTPAVAFLTRNLDFTSGVMISASHNPAIDNGIKFFDSNGLKLADDIEEKIEKIVKNKQADLPEVPGDKVGRIYSGEDLLDKYKEFLMKNFQMDLSGKTIVVDCANGSASFLMPEILKNLKCNVIPINNEPNGININLNCGSTHMEALKKAVLDHGADLGIAHDGDSDRVLFVNHNGEEVDGDMVMAIIANDLKIKNSLKNNTLVGTVMSNLGLKKYLQEREIFFIEAKVGDRYVLEEMLKNNAVAGGEQSGHLIFLDYNTTGDGILTALIVLRLMNDQKKSIEELLADFQKYPQVLKNAKVPNKVGWEKNLVIQRSISKNVEILGAEGRILVRASGTENLIRVMVEGKDYEQIDQIASEIENVILGELS